MKEDNFVRVKINGIYFYSCYMPPSMPQEDFERVLDRLVDDARNRRPVAIAGNFKAWAVEWGSKEKKKRGQALLEAFSLLDLTLLNYGMIPMFRREELLRTNNRVGNNKAPGMANIPNVALKTAIKAGLEMFLDMYIIPAFQREFFQSNGSDKEWCSCLKRQAIG